MIRFFSPLRLVLLAVLLIATATGFFLVPGGTMIPVHWNLAAEPDLFLQREWGLLWPGAVALLIWGIMLGVNRMAQPDDRVAGAHIVAVTLSALTALLAAIEIATVLIGTGVATNMVQVIAVGIGLLLLVLGNAMPKSRPNSFAGIRMPSTLRSETNWLATHRLGGMLTIAGGLVLLLAAFLLPVSTLVWWIAACVLIPMLIASAYSLAIARRGV